MSNIRNTNIGNLDNDMWNGMTNVDGMNGVKQKKFNPNVFGSHYNLYWADYLHIGFKTKGSRPDLTNTVTDDRYNSNNNDNINSSDNTNNNGASNMNNLNNLRNMSNLNSLNDRNYGASNLFDGIGNGFSNLNGFGNSNNTYNLNNVFEPNTGFMLQLKKWEQICCVVNESNNNNDNSNDNSGNNDANSMSRILTKNYTSILHCDESCVIMICNDTCDEIIRVFVFIFILRFRTFLFSSVNFISF